MRYADEYTDFSWKWIEPRQESAMREPRMERAFGGPQEPDGENLKRLRPAQFVRRAFTLRERPVRATAYATAHGLYRLFVNGQRPDWRVLAPEVTPFDKLLTYQVYDVTALLRPGENAVGAILTDGWHIGRIGLTGDSCQYADRLAFLFQLDVTYPDGGTERIVSDASFRGTTGPIDYSDIYIGERYDARKEMPGWSAPGFDDDLWTPVEEKDFPEALKRQTLAPTLKHERFKGKRMTTPRGELVFDFGQVIAGVERVRLKGRRGDAVKLEHSEILDRDGCFIRNIGGRNKQQTDEYVCAGTGEEVYEPVGSYHGFRYLKVTGEAEVLEAEAFAIRTANRETAAFSCSDERLNQLWQNITWSLRGNTISIPTDCPQRERSGFTGDMQVIVRTACWLMDMRSFAASWLETVRLEQSERGEVTVIAPNFPALEAMQLSRPGAANTSCGWGDAITIVPWWLYQFYGDESFLRDNYEAMKKWVAFVTRWAETGESYPGPDAPVREGHQRYLWNTGFSFGDWLVPSRSQGMSNPFATAEETKGPIGTCYYAGSVELLGKTARVLGDLEEAARCDALLARIKAAYRAEYCLGDGLLRSNLQGIYVTALAFGMLPEAERPQAAARLAELIRANGDRLDTGFLSVGHLMDALCDNGQRETAYRLLYQTQCPSWLYEVEKGATTMWESWNAVLPDGTTTASSYNHYAFGCVADWMMRTLAGIRGEAPGFARLRVDPDFSCGLTGVSARYDSARGTISVRWNRKGNEIEARVVIPEGVEAVFGSGASERPLKPGENEIHVIL